MSESKQMSDAKADSDQPKKVKLAEPRKQTHQKSPPNPILEFLFAPTYWPVGLFEWAVAWFFTRRWWMLIPIVPVLTLVALFSYQTMKGAKLSPVAIAGRYLDRANRAESDGDTRLQQLCYERLLGLPLGSDTRFKIASAMEQNGKKHLARKHMLRLAPDNAVGYGRAHLWRVQDLINANSSDLIQLMHHAEAAYNQNPNDTASQVVLSQVWLNAGKTIDGLALLEKAAKRQPNLNLPIARLHKQIGNESNSRLHLDLAKQFYRGELIKDVKDLNARRGLLQSLIVGEETDEAVSVAEDGHRILMSEESRELVAACYLAKFDSLPDNVKTTAEGLRWLQASLKALPSNTSTLERIATLITSNPNREWGDLRDELENVLTKGTAPAIVHVILADAYLTRNNEQKAKLHLEQAFRQDSDMLVALNNLAWLLAHSKEPDFERAIRLVNRAWELDPKNPEVLETRGIIHMRMENYSEAIADLEPLLSVFPDRSRIRFLLADAYTSLNDATLAEKFRKQGAVIDARLKNDQKQSGR